MKLATITQRINHLQAFGATLPGAKVYYRDDWQTIYFDLLGKQFGMMSPQASASAIITLKNLPPINESLREEYPEVILPGYYANKTHWNSFLLGSELLTDEMLAQMITTSYQLVYQKLTKKQKAMIQ